MKNKPGFSLIEVLIVIAILAILLIIGSIIYTRYLDQARDTERKSDLERLQKIIEGFYNDNGCYPQPTEICYDATSDDDNPCYICGSEANPMPNYQLPCNPNHPTMKYLYEVEDNSCPSWYRVYTEFANKDNDICPHSLCGPGGGGYDYGVSSPNIALEVSDDLWGYEPGWQCVNCGEMAECEEDLQRGKISNIYGSETTCCDEEPQADNCNWVGWSLAENDCITCHGTLNYCGPRLDDLYMDKPEGTAMELCCQDHSSAPSCL